jgi:hypothetical protein
MSCVSYAHACVPQCAHAFYTRVAACSEEHMLCSRQRITEATATSTYTHASRTRVPLGIAGQDGFQGAPVSYDVRQRFMKTTSSAAQQRVAHEQDNRRCNSVPP